MSQIHFLFILSLIFFSVSSVSLKREKTTTQSNYFLSFLRVVEFFKDASPSSNKMMNFHHYETAHRIINLVQTNNETFNSTNNETNDDNNITNLNNVTNDNNTTTNTSSQTKETNQLTVEDIQNIIHKENKILKDEILENENDIESDLKKESYKIYKKIDETEYKIVNKIVSSSEKLEKKIDKIEEKVDENIEQTEESSIIIISEQIKEKEENLKLLKAEINDLKIVLNNEKEITNVCELYNSCTDCTSNPKCGWCILEEKCVGGDHIGPSEEQCTFYSYHYCSSLSCARNTDCYVNRIFF